MNILALCNILILSNALDERTYCSEDSPNEKRIPLAERYKITHSRGLSVYLLIALDDRFVITRNGKATTTSIPVFALSILANLSACILAYKRKAEESGMQGAIGCTSSLLQEQLEDCLSVWPRCLTAFRIKDKQNRQSGDLNLSMDRDLKETSGYQLLPKLGTTTTVPGSSHSFCACYSH